MKGCFDAPFPHPPTQEDAPEPKHQPDAGDDQRGWEPQDDRWPEDE